MVFEGAASYTCYYLFITSDGYGCTEELPSCMPRTVAQVMIYLMVGMCVVYLGLYWYFIRKTFEGLASRPYAEARTANMLVRVEVRREKGRHAACRGMAWECQTGISTFPSSRTPCSLLLQSWQMGIVFVAIIICIAALLLVRMKACWTYLFAWLSMMPMQGMAAEARRRQCWAD